MQGTFVTAEQEQRRKERILWLTVLSEAVRDATEGEPRHRRAALEWLLLDTEDFPEICDLAGIDPEYLRKITNQRSRFA